MKNKYIKVIVIIYLTLNIIGVIFYYTIPKSNFVKGMSGTDLKEPVKLGMEYEFLENPHLLADKNLQEKWNIKNYTFNYEGKELKLIFSKEQDQVIIDRKVTQDNKIEIYWYSGVRYVNGVDLSDLIKEPEVKLTDTYLNISFEKQRYNFTKFSKDIVINQFYDNNNEKDQDSGIVGSLNSGIIYIKIPKDLNVLGAEEYKFVKD